MVVELPAHDVVARGKRERDNCLFSPLSLSSPLAPSFAPQAPTRWYPDERAIRMHVGRVFALPGAKPAGPWIDLTLVAQGPVV